MLLPCDNQNTWVLDSNIRSESDIALLPRGSEVVFPPLYLSEVPEFFVKKLLVECNQRSLVCYYAVSDDNQPDKFILEKGVPPFEKKKLEQALQAFDMAIAPFGEWLRTYAQLKKRGPLFPPSITIPENSLFKALTIWIHAVFTVSQTQVSKPQKRRAVGIVAKIGNGDYSELHDITFLHIALDLGCGLFSHDKILRECASALSIPLMPPI